MKFALFGNVFQPEKSSALAEVIKILKDTSSIIAIEQAFYDFVRKNNSVQFEPDEIITSSDFSASFAISLGGDGTFLKTADFVGDKGIPIIGINTGRLGFLADIADDEIAAMFNGLAHGEYTIEKRSVLHVVSPTELKGVSPFALNEIAILKHDNSSMIGIETTVDNSYLNTYQSDGIIVCTPTGSTGYSLSNGGPIIAPNSNSIAITAVAPHSLNIRPVLLNDDCTVKMKVNSRNHNFLLSIDGRSLSLSDDTPVTIRKAPYFIYIVRKYGNSYFDTLRNKLMWGADKRL
ncbi:MAG TPA: NAD kinase [Prevotellaceae bacterium]|nr:NAD kinase [Prevotellaceae bacterium]